MNEHLDGGHTPRAAQENVGHIFQRRQVYSYWRPLKAAYLNETGSYWCVNTVITWLAIALDTDPLKDCVILFKNVSTGPCDKFHSLLTSRIWITQVTCDKYQLAVAYHVLKYKKQVGWVFFTHHPSAISLGSTFRGLWSSRTGWIFLVTCENASVAETIQEPFGPILKEE